MNKPEVLVALLHDTILSRSTSRKNSSSDGAKISSSSAPKSSYTTQTTLSVNDVNSNAFSPIRNSPENLTSFENNQWVLDTLRAAVTFVVTSPSNSPTDRASHLQECLDSFTSSCALGEKDFDRVLSETLPAIGMTALEYEIFRWDPIWEEDYGTLELSVAHSELGTGLEAVKFVIDHWIPQCTDHTERQKLMDVVRRACLYRTRGASDPEVLQLDEDVANKLLQRISRVVMTRLSDSKEGLMVAGSGDTFNHAEYTISLTSAQNNNEGKKGKSCHALSSTSYHQTYGDEFTALISLPNFIASLRDTAMHAMSHCHPTTFIHPVIERADRPLAVVSRHRRPSSLSLRSQVHRVSRRQNPRINHDRPRRNDLESFRYDRISSERLRFKPALPLAQHSSHAVPSGAPQLSESSYNSAALRVEFIGGARLWALDVGKRTLTLAVIGGLFGGDSTHEKTPSNECSVVVHSEIRIVPSSPTDMEPVFTFPSMEIRHPLTQTTSRTISNCFSSMTAFNQRQHEGLSGPIDSFNDPRLLQDDGAFLLELRVRLKKAASTSKDCTAITQTESDSTPSTLMRVSGLPGSENIGEPSYEEERSEMTFSSYDELSIPDMFSGVPSETGSWVSIHDNQEALSHPSDSDT